MTTTHTTDQAARIAGSAIAKLAEHAIAPTPENFTVWYHYVAGTMPELTRHVDGVLGQDGEVDETRWAEIFTTFFAAGPGPETLRQATDRVEAELTAVLEALEQAGGGAAAYGETLESVRGQISAVTGPEDLGAVIAGVLAQTRAMADRMRHLEGRLNDSASQISMLNSDLEDMRERALTDSLTGIANRQHFDSAITRAIAESRAEGWPLSLLVIDIDHFKRFNDTYGHLVGDQVLKLLGATLTECIKGQDVAARYGGEEFAVVLPRTTLENAARVGETIRQRVGAKEVVNLRSGERMGQVTVSVGVGQHRDAEPPSQLVARADAALYLAKNAGRNRVALESDLPGPERAVGS